MVTNILNRKYPEKKQLLYQNLQSLPNNYKVIALSKMNKVRATQLMTIRKKFHETIYIKIIKNKVAQKAFEKVTNVSGIDDLAKQLEGQCALMFTNTSPFKLNLIFDENKVFLPAKGGDIATSEIVIPAGNTGIPPGPVLSEFKEANLQTKIDQGSISVTKDKIVAKRGDVISQNLASLLTKLNIKPIKAGISVNYAISEGLQFKEQDLKLDVGQYIQDIQKLHSSALNLAIECAYVTRETVDSILSIAHLKSLNLALSSVYLTKDTVEVLIGKAQSNAHNLLKSARSKGYDL